MPKAATPPQGRFWVKVDASGGPDACWPWRAGVMSAGYGMFHPGKGQSVLAHRFAYEAMHGAGSATGLFVDHTCHNGESCPPGPCPHRLCCNPKHLEAVTNQENVNRSHNSNIRKMHCPKGHAYSPENTRYQAKANTVSRKCITCERDRSVIAPHEKKAA